GSQVERVRHRRGHQGWAPDWLDALTRDTGIAKPKAPGTRGFFCLPRFSNLPAGNTGDGQRPLATVAVETDPPMIAHKKPRKSGVFCASSLIEGCGYGAQGRT